MITNGDFIKTINSSNEIITGTVEKLDDFYVTNTLNIFDDNNNIVGFSKNYLKINPNICAKKLMSIPLGDIFEYDVFLTPDGVNFYVYFDYKYMSILYMAERGKYIEDNINIYDCKLVGNLIIDSVLNNLFD